MSTPRIASRRTFLQTAGAAAAASIGLPAHAQSDYPKGPLKLIVGLPPGGRRTSSRAPALHCSRNR